MKRLLVLNYEFPPLGGGASPVSYELAKRLSETGEFDIDAVTMGYKDLPAYEAVNKNFRIHRVRSWRSKKEICHPWEQLTYLISGWWKCKALLKKNTYDVCHCHFIIPTGVLALKLNQKFSLPYVITSHGSDVLGYNKRFRVLYPFLTGVWKKILNEAKKITAPSYFLKSEIMKVYGAFDAEKIIVIPNGFDAASCAPQEKNKSIFSSGRLVENKGFQYLIQAVSDHDIGYDVHIAGDGPMMPILKKLAERSKTTVVLHGWLDNRGTEYINLLEQSAIFVLASAKENASVALLEAMSAGCAIITTDIAGSRELLGEAGNFVRPHDVPGLRLAIEDMIHQPEAQKTLQALSARRVKKMYQWDGVLKAYENVL